MCPLPTAKNVKVNSKKESIKVVAKKGDASQGMAIFIKFFLLINAAGDMMSPVYVIADNNMLVEELDVYNIKGLGIGAEPGSSAYLCFCKTRSCNRCFFEWLHYTVLTKAFCWLRSVYGLGEEQPVWFQLDGEPGQIACYELVALQNHLSKMNIAVEKPLASTAEVTQPCNCGNCFKGCKTMLKQAVSKKLSIESNE